MCCRFRQIISSNVPPIFFIFSHWNFRRPAADPYIEIKRRYNVRNKVYFNLSKDCTITIPDASTVYNTGMLHKLLHKKKPACTCKSDAYGLFIHQTKYRSPHSPHFLYLCDVLYHPPNIYTVRHVTKPYAPRQSLNMSGSRIRPPSPPASLPTGRKACRLRYRPSSRPHRQCKYPLCPY